MNKEQIAYEKGYRVTKDGELIGLFNTKIGCVNGKGYEQTGIRLNKKHINLDKEMAWVTFRNRHI